MCPHTAISVSSLYVASSYYYVCALILLYMCPHYILRPHTTIYLSSCYYMCPQATVCVSSYYFMCPHTTTYVSSYYYTCVPILLHMCPHTTISASSYSYICVLILLYLCPQVCLSIALSASAPADTRVRWHHDVNDQLRSVKSLVKSVVSSLLTHARDVNDHFRSLLYAIYIYIILRRYMPSTRYSMRVTYSYVCVLIPVYVPRASVDSQALQPAMLFVPHTFYVC